METSLLIHWHRRLNWLFQRQRAIQRETSGIVKRFAREITDQNFLQTVSAKLPWSHNLVLIEKLKTMESRYWYGVKAIENGWSVAVLEHQIATGLIDREQGGKLQNFEKLLPEVQSELAIQTMKDPYIF